MAYRGRLSRSTELAAGAGVRAYGVPPLTRDTPGVHPGGCLQILAGGEKWTNAGIWPIRVGHPYNPAHPNKTHLHFFTSAAPYFNTFQYNVTFLGI